MLRPLLIAAAALTWASAASAASISLEWAGTGGANEITVYAGGSTHRDRILNVMVSADAAGIGFVSVRLDAGGEVNFAGLVSDGTSEVCPSPPNLAPGVCGTAEGFLTNAHASVEARQIHLGAFNSSVDGPVDTRFLLAQVIVNVPLGSRTFGTVTLSLEQTVRDNQGNDITDTVILGIAYIHIIPIPEPTTGGLLTLGVIALAVSGRRRRPTGGGAGWAPAE